MKALADRTALLTGDAPLGRVALHLAWPAMGMMYLIAAFNIIDTQFAGRLGAASLAGLATGSFVFWELLGLANLVSIGTGAVVARRMGEGQPAEAERAAYQGLLLSLISSLLSAAVLWTLAPWIFHTVMGATDDVTREGLPFLRIVLAGAPTIFLSITAAQIFQSLGDTSRPLRLMMLALVVTAVADYAFMLGRLGMPKLGVSGAGVALIASRLLFCVLAIGTLVSGGYHGFRARPHGVRGVDWPLARRIAGIGLPTCLEGVLFPVVYMILTRYVTAHGTAEVAALRVGHTVEGITFFGALGMGIAMRPLVGQNLGAGRVERAEKAPWRGFGLIAVPVFLYSIVLFFAPEWVAGLFTDDASVVQAGGRYLHILSWCQIFMAAELVFVGAFSGAGETLTPMLIVVPFTLARWPIAAWTQTLGLGVEGVWWTISATGIAKGLVMVWAFRRGRWKRREV